MASGRRPGTEPVRSFSAPDGCPSGGSGASWTVSSVSCDVRPVARDCWKGPARQHERHARLGSLRECRHALWRGTRGPSRRHDAAGARRVLFSHRTKRRRQVEPSEAHLPRRAAVARPHLAVWPRSRDDIAPRIAGAAPAHRRGVSGFPLHPASLGTRQRGAAAARRRPPRRPHPRQRRRAPALGRSRRRDRRQTGDAVGRPAAARRHRPRRRQQAEPAARRRADRQCRRSHRGTAVAPLRGTEPPGHHHRRRHPRGAANRSLPAHPSAPREWRADRHRDGSAGVTRGTCVTARVRRKRGRLDLPTDGDGAGRFLPWIIGLMVYLAALALAGMMALQGAIGRWDGALAGTLTVQLPAGASGELEKALALLRSTPGVERAEPLDQAPNAALLERWLGPGLATDELRLPRLIDLRVDPKSAIDLVALARRLAAVAPSARLDDNRSWLDRL